MQARSPHGLWKREQNHGGLLALEGSFETQAAGFRVTAGSLGPRRLVPEDSGAQRWESPGRSEHMLLSHPCPPVPEPWYCEMHQCQNAETCPCPLVKSHCPEPLSVAKRTPSRLPSDSTTPGLRLAQRGADGRTLLQPVASALCLRGQIRVCALAANAAWMSLSVQGSEGTSGGGQG